MDGARSDQAVATAPRQEQEPERDEPQGEMEQALAQLWQELFHLEKVGRNTNFFELGGDSLLGMTLMERLETRFAVQLPVVALFQNPSIRELTQVIVAPAEPL